MARKLFWPLVSSYNFTQWGWRIPFGPDDFPEHIEIDESPPNCLFLRNLQTGRTYFCPLFYQQQLTTMRIEPSNSWTFGSSILDPGVPNWIRIRRINSASDNSATSFLDNIKETAFTSLSRQPGPLLYGWTFTPILNLQLNTCYVYSDEHDPLRYSAAVILSQRDNHFFLRDLQHKGTLYSGCH